MLHADSYRSRFAVPGKRPAPSAGEAPAARLRPLAAAAALCRACDTQGPQVGAGHAVMHPRPQMVRGGRCRKKEEQFLLSYKINRKEGNNLLEMVEVDGGVIGGGKVEM